MTLILEDAKGNDVGTVIVDVSEFNETLTLSVCDVYLWSAEHPYLYRVFLKIIDASAMLVEVVPQKVGFRQYQMKNNIMHINGERIVFRGVNRHEFNQYHGRAISKEDMLADIKILKQNNINAVRTSHYP